VAVMAGGRCCGRWGFFVFFYVRVVVAVGVGLLGCLSFDVDLGDFVRVLVVSESLLLLGIV